MDTMVGEASFSNTPRFVERYLAQPGKRISYIRPVLTEEPDENGEAEGEQSEGRDSTDRSQNWYFASPVGRLGSPFAREDHGRSTELTRRVTRDDQMGTSQGDRSGRSTAYQRFENGGESNRSTTPEPAYDARNVDIERRFDRPLRRNEASGDYSRTIDGGLDSEEKQGTPKGFNFALLGGLNRSKRLSYRKPFAEDAELANPPATRNKSARKNDHLPTASDM